MQYNSLEFLYGFFPLFLAVYYMFRHRHRGAVLLVGSLVFYALSSGGSYWWVALLVLITLLSYLAGLTLGKPKRGWLLGLYLTCLLGILSFFKLWQGGRYLPAGMSFYLFQIAAYLIDVQRQKLRPEKKLADYMNQIIMFPKLLSGPLMQPRVLKLQEKFCRPRSRDVHDGLQLLILGLGLKVVLANRMGGIWGQANVIGFESISTPYAWIALASWAMQLYFDFFGYSLMAMGIGRMLGYDLPENFIDPYASRSVSEFYRRWHATLGAWFKEYLYIPLGGNRKGTFRTLVNLAVVWLFTGLWHGVGGNYLLWAGILYVLIVNERLWLGKHLKNSRFFSHVYVVFVILLSWVPFAVGDWNLMLTFFAKLFCLGGKTLNPLDFMNLWQDYALLLGCGILCATPMPRKLWEKIKGTTFGDFLLFALFWVVVYYISTAAQDPFLYFQY